MEKKTSVMIGSSCIDEYYETTYIPQAGEKTLTTFIGKSVGGMIGNAAAVAASYGLDVHLMDVMTTGANTEFILEDCKKAGICLDMIRYDETLSDVRCMLFTKDGERTIFVVPTQKVNVEPDEEQKKILTSAEYVYTNLEELKYFKDPLGFVDWLCKMGIKLVLDVEFVDESTKELEWEFMKSCSILYVNEEGQRQLSAKISKSFIEELNERGCLVVATKGKAGCQIFDPKGGSVEVPAFEVQPVDTTGAGDTFNSSFLYGLTQGWNIEEAARFANGAAARAILYRGARSGAVGVKEVEHFICENQK